jgi:thiamine biosynthesis protein ThiI
VDVRKDKSYIYEQKISGFGRFAAGNQRKGMVMLSGGIDSPVAAWMMAKRAYLSSKQYIFTPTLIPANGRRRR